MGKYSKAELDRNRKSVSNVALIGMFLVLVGFMTSGFSFASLFAGLIGLSVLVGVLWWLFASRRASNIDGTWVDGWKWRGRWWEDIGGTPWGRDGE